MYLYTLFLEFSFSCPRSPQLLSFQETNLCLQSIYDFLLRRWLIKFLLHKFVSFPFFPLRGIEHVIEQRQSACRISFVWRRRKCKDTCTCFGATAPKTEHERKKHSFWRSASSSLETQTESEMQTLLARKTTWQFRWFMEEFRSVKYKVSMSYSYSKLLIALKWFIGHDDQSETFAKRGKRGIPQISIDHIFVEVIFCLNAIISGPNANIYQSDR